MVTQFILIAICIFTMVAFFIGYVGLIKADEYIMGSVMAAFGWFMAVVVFIKILEIVRW